MIRFRRATGRAHLHQTQAITGGSRQFLRPCSSPRNEAAGRPPAGGMMPPARPFRSRRRPLLMEKRYLHSHFASAFNARCPIAFKPRRSSTGRGPDSPFPPSRRSDASRTNGNNIRPFTATSSVSFLASERNRGAHPRRRHNAACASCEILHAVSLAEKEARLRRLDAAKAEA